jgi:hypothetical protein
MLAVEGATFDRDASMRNGFLFLAVAGLLAAGTAQAAGVCELALHPQTSGFFLNPVLEKVVVVTAKPASPGKPCALMADDELLQVNDQVIPGQRASKVMLYWKGLKDDAPRVFKVRRKGVVVDVDLTPAS